MWVRNVGTVCLNDSSASYRVYISQLGLYSLGSWTGLQVTNMPDALEDVYKAILSLSLLFSPILSESRHKLPKCPLHCSLLIKVVVGDLFLEEET